MTTARPRLSVALRLTLWYAAAFAASSVLALAFVYGSVVGVLRARIDTELRLDLAEMAALVNRGGVAAFGQELARERSGPDSAVVFLRLWSPSAAPVVTVGFDPPDWALRAAVAAQAGRAEAALRTVRPSGAEHAVRAGLARLDGGYVLEAGQSLHEVDELLAALLSGVLVALPVVILLGGPIGWFMARRALRGVGVVTRTAIEIADGAIGRRVPVGTRGDELDRLAQAFNGMLDRIQALIAGMRDVTDNLAHDLRTPLARIRASAERAASRQATREEWLGFAGTTVEECDRLLQILNGTLEIAEAQAGATDLRLEDVDLSEVAAQAVELFGTLAEDAGVELNAEPSPRCVVRADRGRVQRIVANLLDNAIKYTPAGGRVTVSLAAEEGDVRLRIRDTGRGVSAEDLPRIFERFYRGDGSRSGRGSGLGLSLARAFARAHGGDLTAVSTPGEGSEFTLWMKRRLG